MLSNQHAAADLIVRLSIIEMLSESKSQNHHLATVRLQRQAYGVRPTSSSASTRRSAVRYFVCR